MNNNNDDDDDNMTEEEKYVNKVCPTEVHHTFTMKIKIRM